MKSSNRSRNMRELINTVSKDLGVDRNEAELITAALLGRPRFELYLANATDERDRQRVSSCVKKMKTGVPLEYLTGNVQFRDHDLVINPGVFIPRSETEYMVERIERMTVRPPGAILEIGTGCGALAITLASLYPDADVVATDISVTAVRNARQNVKRHGLGSRIRIVQCDLYDGITGRFDLIVSNPPYIPRARLGELPGSVKDFEPHRALDGGESGVQLIERIIAGSRAHLSAGGIMALEIDDDAAGPIEAIMKDNHIMSYSFHADQYGRCRYLFIGVLHEKS